MKKTDNFFSTNHSMLDNNSIQIPTVEKEKKITKKDIFFFPNDKDEKVELKKLSNLCDSYLFTENKLDQSKKEKLLKNENNENNDNNTTFNFHYLLAPENKISLSLKKAKQNSVNVAIKEVI